MFLEQHGWSIVSTVGQDSSIRRYYRVRKGDQTAILMETVPDNSPKATPGHSLSAFLEIAAWLNSIGVNAPDIYEVDAANGLVILEDFGGMCFKYAAGSGADSKELYAIASDVLDHIGAHNCPLSLPQYYESHVHRRHRRIADYYLPLVRQEENSVGAVEAYRAIWQDIESSLPLCPQGFVHVDYHAENLMYLPQETGIKKCGILDFQGAMIGPAPYDLANLLEDARTDVPEEIKQEALKDKDKAFLSWYRVLATQFHCRVIGQFIKQAAIDNNPHYLPHIPRLQNYIKQGLEDPILKPLAEFFDDLNVSFEEPIPQDLSFLKNLIAEDAL